MNYFQIPNQIILQNIRTTKLQNQTNKSNEPLHLWVSTLKNQTWNPPQFRQNIHPYYLQINP